MNISIHLNTGSIQNAIRKLERVKQNLNDGVKRAVSVLTKDGATIAQSAYGSMAVASPEMVSSYVGHIVATDGADGNAVIAEFGAGDATMPILFEGYPDVDVFPGSYSKEVGSGEYARTGKWHFGGQEYTEVPPRAGLYLAKMYIEQEALNVMTEVIKP